MTSDDGTQLIFTSRGCLRKAIDADNNYYTVLYKETSTEDWKITKVVDGAGREFVFTSNTSGKITKITDPAGREISFSYSNNKLDRITYPDTTSTEFKYTGNYLEAIHSRNGGWIKYTYPESGDTAARSRVFRVEEYSSLDTGDFSSANLGNYIEFNFNKMNRTQFTDNRNRTETYIFDNYGRTVNIYDADGGTSVYKYESGSTTGKKANTLLSNSIGKRFVDNLFLNHSFENGLNNWTYSGASVSQSQHYLGFKSIDLSSGGYIRQRVDKTSGSFNVSAYVKGSSASSKARIQIYFYDSSGNCLNTYNSKTFDLETDWQRIYYPFTIVSGTSYLIARVSNTGTDNIWVDCAQMGSTYSVNEYNLLENGGMENTVSSAWIKYKCTDSDGYSTGYYGRNIRIFGDCVTKKKIYQTVQINQPAKDLHLTLSTSAYADSVPLSGERKFCLGVTTYFTDDTTVYNYFSFHCIFLPSVCQANHKNIR